VKRHLLVFDDGNGAELDLQDFVDSLDAGAQIYTLDDHVCFLRSGLSTTAISDRFLAFAGSRQFFIADVSSSDCTGRMVGSFWDFMKRSALPTAAE
jgi:hypothetical protein